MNTIFFVRNLSLFALVKQHWKINLPNSSGINHFCHALPARKVTYIVHVFKKTRRKVFCFNIVKLINVELFYSRETVVVLWSTKVWL